MRSSDLRTFAWLASIVVFIPSWTGLMYLIAIGIGALESGFDLILPGWLKGTIHFLSVPAVLLPVSNCMANRTDLSVGSTRSRSASWELQGNCSAAGRK